MRNLSRRQFLYGTTAAAVVAGTGLVSAAEAGPLRLGLIGCGARGQALLSKLQRLQRYGEQLVVAAVCDVNQGYAAEAGALAQAEVYSDWKALLSREDLDGVLIATPDHWHAEMAARAMAAGKDVYCEQPMALHHTEAGELCRIAREKGRVMQVGAQAASEGQWAVARGLLEDQTLGALRWSQASADQNSRGLAAHHASSAPSPASIHWPGFLGAAPSKAFDSDRYVNWRHYWDYSSGVISAVHYQQLIGFLTAMGPIFPEKVSVAGGVFAHESQEAPDTMMANLDYPGGHTIALVSSMADATQMSPVIRGEKASMELRGGYVYITPEQEHLDSFQRRFGSGASARVKVAGGVSHMEDWLACMRSRGTCRCFPELGYAAQVATSMMVRAYRKERAVYYDAARKQIVDSSPMSA